MPKGPQGQKRPADAIGLAVLVGKIATGEIKETTPKPTRKKSQSSPKSKGRDKLSPKRG